MSSMILLSTRFWVCATIRTCFSRSMVAGMGHITHRWFVIMDLIMHGRSGHDVPVISQSQIRVLTGVRAKYQIVKPNSVR